MTDEPLRHVRLHGHTVALGESRVARVALSAIVSLYDQASRVTDGRFSLPTTNVAVRCQPLGLNQLRHTPVPDHPLQLEDRMESTLQGLG